MTYSSGRSYLQPKHNYFLKVSNMLRVSTCSDGAVNWMDDFEPCSEYEFICCDCFCDGIMKFIHEE